MKKAERIYSRRRLMLLGAAWLLYLGCFGAASAGITIVPVSLGRIAGVGFSWGFFAPGVASAVRVRVTELDGAEIEVFDNSARREVDLRAATLLSTVVSSSERARSAMAAYLAARAFEIGDYLKVRVEVQFYDVPTMTRFARGARPAWRTWYRAEFERSVPTSQP